MKKLEPLSNFRYIRMNKVKVSELRTVASDCTLDKSFYVDTGATEAIDKNFGICVGSETLDIHFGKPVTHKDDYFKVLEKENE